jgi:hypothetical protein
MSASAPVSSDAQRWMEWQDRGLDGDRRRAVAMRWVLAIIAITLAVLFGRAW